jgi:hypothetical protein
MGPLYLILACVLLGLFAKVIFVLAKPTAILTPILGWIVGLGFFLLVPLAIIAVNGGYQSPTFYDVNGSHADVNLVAVGSLLPFLFIWMSLLLSFLAVLLFAPRRRQGLARREVIVDDAVVKKIILVTTCFAVVDYIVSIQTAGGFEQFLITNWYLRGSDLAATLGDRYVLYSWLAQANQTVFTAAAVLFMHSQARKGTVNWRFTSLLAAIFLIHIAFQGERIYLALYLISIFTSCWLYGRKRAIVGMVLIAPALAFVFSAWAYFRNAPTEITKNVSVYRDADLGNRAVTVLMDACDGSDTVFLFHIINDFGEKYPFLYGTSYARAFSFMVPRSLYPDKPKGFALHLAEIYEPNENTSFAATQLGELYANFGPVSVLLLPLLTLIVFFGSEWLTRRMDRLALTSSVVFLLLIWSARATLEDNFITFVLVTLLIRIFRFERRPVAQECPPSAALAV